MGDRVPISLVCEVCGSRNYKRDKARKPGENERIQMKKFCPKCRRHTLHKESR
ncbi:MAG: 50S ribosomal protein L33 [Myxococcota bacterium]